MAERKWWHPGSCHSVRAKIDNVQTFRYFKVKITRDINCMQDKMENSATAVAVYNEYSETLHQLVRSQLTH